MLIHGCDPPGHLDVESFQAGASWRLVVDLTETDGVTTLVFRQLVDPADEGASSYGPGWSTTWIVSVPCWRALSSPRGTTTTPRSRPTGRSSSGGPPQSIPEVRQRRTRGSPTRTVVTPSEKRTTASSTLGRPAVAVRLSRRDCSVAARSGHGSCSTGVTRRLPRCLV